MSPSILPLPLWPSRRWLPTTWEHHHLLHILSQTQVTALELCLERCHHIEFDINEGDIEETKRSLPRYRHNRIHISKIVKHKLCRFNAKPFAVIAISAATTAISIGIIAGVATYFQNPRPENKHHEHHSETDDHIKKVRAFAKGRLSKVESITLHLPTPPTIDLSKKPLDHQEHQRTAQH